MMPRPKLKPCPFCGSRDNFISKEMIDTKIGIKSIFYVECRRCRMCGPWASCADYAVNEWDEREVDDA